jgi:hypothetical protein
MQVPAVSLGLFTAPILLALIRYGSKPTPFPALSPADMAASELLADENFLGAKVVIVCFTRFYRNSESMMRDYRCMKALPGVKPLILCVLEDNMFTWINQEYIKMLMINQIDHFDLGKYAESASLQVTLALTSLLGFSHAYSYISFFLFVVRRPALRCTRGDARRSHTRSLIFLISHSENSVVFAIYSKQQDASPPSLWSVLLLNRIRLLV